MGSERKSDKHIAAPGTPRGKQLDQVMQHNTATAEELAGQADQLRHSMAFFKVDESAWEKRVEHEPGPKTIQPQSLRDEEFERY